LRKYWRLLGRGETMARITHELAFIWFVNGKKFAERNEAERYYEEVVEKENIDALNRGYKEENRRDRE
jgi:hypothetical protein